MSAKVDSTSTAEPYSITMSGITSSAAPSGQKFSMFASKSGFVIPKNKLSGSLIPIFRGAKRHGVAGATTNEESSPQIHRKTKWGPDPTQDASVKRGRALALQIRVDQITKLLKSGKLEVGNTLDSPTVTEIPDPSSSDCQTDSKKLEMLELEKREAIGEILKLDPSYKPPPGFKPLLKEATVPLPVKDYPGYNFFVLIYGPEGDNQKRLEKETGAKIQVHGTKTDTGEKVELKGGYDVHCTYEEMHVKISADSFEKVDTAVSIIELLITSVTGNLAAASTPSLSVSGDNANVLTQGQDGISSHGAAVTVENQPLVQPVAGAAQVLDHFQYAGSWFSTAPSNNPVFASSSNIGPPNLSGHARPFHSPSQTMNPSDMSSTFGAQPMPVAGFNSIIPYQPALSLQGQPPRQILQHSRMPLSSPLGHIGPPRNPSIISGQMPSAQMNSALPFAVSVTQSGPVGQIQTAVPSLPQPMTGISPMPLPDRPLIALGATSVQGGASGNATVTLGFSSMGHTAPPIISPSRPVSLHPQTDVSFKPPPSNIPMVPYSVAYPLHQAGIPPGLPSSLGPMQIPATPPANHLSGSVSFPSSGLSTSLPPSHQSGIPNSATGVAPYQTSVRPPNSTSSNSGNFTFHPQRPNADFQVVSRTGSKPAAQGGTQEQPSGPQPPSFRFSVPDQPVNQIIPRPQVLNQLDQTQGHASAVPFGGSSGAMSIPPRHTSFPYAGQLSPRSAVPQMGMRNFIPGPHPPNWPSPGVPRARNLLIQQNNFVPKTWPDLPLPPNQKFSNNHSMASGKPVYPADQIYDPFSPTSAAPPQQRGDPAK